MPPSRILGSGDSQSSAGAENSAVGTRCLTLASHPQLQRVSQQQEDHSWPEEQQAPEHGRSSRYYSEATCCSLSHDLECVIYDTHLLPVECHQTEGHGVLTHSCLRGSPHLHIFVQPGRKTQQPALSSYSIINCNALATHYIRCNCNQGRKLWRPNMFPKN